MIFEILLFTFVGIIAGTLFSFIPGFHINNLIPILFAIPILTGSPIAFSVLIISISVTQQFVSNIMSIFLGAPSSGDFLSVLPGHRMLLEGKGYKAIFGIVVGSMGSLFASILIIFFLFDYFKIIYSSSRPYMHFILLGISAFLLATSGDRKSIIFSILIFVLSGILGVLVLNSFLLTKTYSLFPLLSGLFGVSLLMNSMNENSSIPKQEEEKKFVVEKNHFRNILLGSLAGIAVGFLPALGVSQAAAIFSFGNYVKSPLDFLMTVGSINIANEMFSMISLFLVNNPRSGASVALQRVYPSITINEVILFLGVIFLTSSVASLLTIFLGRKVPQYLQKINYKFLSLSMITVISVFVFMFTGFLGILVLATSSTIGFLCHKLGVRKSNCMGVLILPSIIFFAGLNPFISSVLRI